MTKTLIFTGGHHNSALEVAIALQKLGWGIIWFGHRHTMLGDHSDSAEYTEVTAAGIPFYTIKAGKFYHTLHPLQLIRIPWGFISTLFLLLKLKQTHQLAGIISFGGYLAVPTVVSGWLLGLPSVTHEQTITAGWANRFIGFFCQKIALTWPQSAQYYPPSKVVVTGLPLRQALLSVTNHPHDTIFVFCGKQGSHTINHTIFALLPQLLTRFTVIHQVGSSTVHHDFAHAQTIVHPRYHPYAYMSVDQVAQAYTVASVVVARAGAHTTYELGFLNIRCVLIPLPNSSHAEQLKQAQTLASSHCAVVLPQADLSPSSLMTSITSALNLIPKPQQFISNSTAKLVDLVQTTFA